MSDKPDDQEPGWGALSAILRLLRPFLALKQWGHDLPHPGTKGGERP